MTDKRWKEIQSLANDVKRRDNYDGLTWELYVELVQLRNVNESLSEENVRLKNTNAALSQIMPQWQPGHGVRGRG